MERGGEAEVPLLVAVAGLQPEVEAGVPEADSVAELELLPRPARAQHQPHAGGRGSVRLHLPDRGAGEPVDIIITITIIIICMYEP